MEIYQPTSATSTTRTGRPPIRILSGSASSLRGILRFSMTSNSSPPPLLSLVPGTLVDNYHTFHAQRVMKCANVRENARIWKSNTKPRDPERCLRTAKNHILRGRRDNARANVFCRRSDDSMQRPICVGYG